MSLNVAILGAGTIAPDFLLSSTFVEGMVPYAIFGQERDIPVMEKLSAQYGLAHIYTDLEELLQDKEVDVVYVALPNSLHYAFAKNALEHGKNVIVEKPFCSTTEQAEELYALAETNHKYVFEAIPNIHFPNFKHIKETLPLLGDIKIVELNVSKYSRRYDAFKAGEILPAFDPKKGGGSLMDMGVYNLHFIVGLFGEPKAAHYFPNMERGIDTSGIMILEYPTFKVCAIAAKDCSAPSCINIQGDKGYIHSDSTTHLMKGVTVKLNDCDAVSTDENLREPHERLAYEIAEFKHVIESNDHARYQELKAQSLGVMKLLTALKSY